MGATARALTAAAALCFAGGASATAPTNYGVKLLTLNGSGSRVVSFTNAQPGPIALAVANGGSSNFAVWIAGPAGRDLLVNVVGAYHGMTVLPEAPAGRYKLAITSDGPWRGQVNRLVPGQKTRSVFGGYSGNGDTVFQTSSTRADDAAVMTASCSCQGNFAVWLYGYGVSHGGSLVFNEIGHFHGEQLLEELPAGQYLVDVQADGPFALNVMR